MANNLEKLTRTLSVSIPTNELQQLIDLIVELSERGEIRKSTCDKYYSIHDTIKNLAVKGNPSEVWKRLITTHPESITFCDRCEMLRKNGRTYPSVGADFPSLIEIIWLLPGEFSSKLRKASAKIISTVVNQVSVEQVQTHDSSQSSFVPSKQEWDDLKSTLINVKEGFDWIKQENQQIKESNAKLKTVTNFFAEHRNFCENDAPGIVSLFDLIANHMYNIPLKKEEFSASQWLYKNARHLSTHRKRKFYQAASSLYKLIIGKEPESYNGCRMYSNQTEFILIHVLGHVNGTIVLDDALAKELILDAASEQVELDLKTPEYEAYPNIPGLELI